MRPMRRNGLRAILGALATLSVLGSTAAVSSAGTTRVGTTTAVAVIGDSLAWQADASIKKDLSGSGYTSRVAVNPGHALASPWAQVALKDDLQQKRFGIIVIETASNDSFLVARATESLDAYAQLLVSLLQTATGRCVVVVNAKVHVTPFYYEPGYAVAVNRVISQTARTYTNERVVAWNQEAAAHPLWFGADLLHFTSMKPGDLFTSAPPPSSDQSAGDKAFAQAIVAGIASCRGMHTHRSAIR